MDITFSDGFHFPYCLPIAERTEEASKAMAARRELQRRMEDVSRDFDEEQKLTFEIRQDMTRQYKGMQEELLSRVSFHYLKILSTDHAFSLNYVLLSHVNYLTCR